MKLNVLKSSKPFYKKILFLNSKCSKRGKILCLKIELSIMRNLLIIGLLLKGMFLRKLTSFTGGE